MDPPERRAAGWEHAGAAALAKRDLARASDQTSAAWSAGLGAARQTRDTQEGALGNHASGVHAKKASPMARGEGAQLSQGLASTEIRMRWQQAWSSQMSGSAQCPHLHQHDT